MVILALINVYLPGYKAGGPIQSLANLGEQLGQGFRLKIITSDRDYGDSKPYPSVAPGKWRQVGNAEVLYLSPSDRSIWNLRRAINGTSYDLLYLNSLFHPGFTLLPLAMWRLGWIRRTPVVLAPRGELSPGALGIKSIRKLLFLFAARSLRLHRRVIWQASCSDEMAEVQRWFPSPLGGPFNTVVAPDLPQRGIVDNGESQPREKKSGHLRLLFASRISPKKNLLEAIRCLEKLEGSVEFNIFGPIDDQAYWEKCRKAAQNLPAGASIRYCGPVPHDWVLFEMSQHDLFFLPTRGENFGHAIVEALSEGCPVLIGNETPWRGLESKRAGWDLPVEDRAGFTAVLQRCVRMDDREFRIWRAGAKKLAAAVVNDDAIVDKNRELFSFAMQKSAPATSPGGLQEAVVPASESANHFDGIASVWERKYVRGGPLHRRAVSFARCLRQSVSRPGRVLDFGCGSGDIAIACREAGYEITGIDLSPAMIARARARSDGRGIAFDLLESDDPFKLPYRDAYFDGVIASSVLEYVRAPLACLQELRRTCKPSAVLIATVPNRFHPRRWLEVALRGPRIRKYFTSVDRWRPYGQYLAVSRNRFRLDDWAALLQSSGWRMDAVEDKTCSLVRLIASRSPAAQAAIQEREPDQLRSGNALQVQG